MRIDPREASAANIYKLMIGLIVPRPIAFVSTLSAAGIRNLAPFSFFTGICSNPPVICFSCGRTRDAQKKDTLRNVEETGEFVVNVVSEEFAAQMNICSTEFPPEVDEFTASGLTPVASELVKPPRVAESRAAMECRLLQIVEVSPQPLGGSLVLGEVLRFHIDDPLFENFKIDAGGLNAIGRMGGAAYTRTRDRFDMERPKR
jgi:flavin reductase (DIM6/NTAB) family NADH-FMN oxidoreductase RutF